MAKNNFPTLKEISRISSPNLVLSPCHQWCRHLGPIGEKDIRFSGEYLTSTFLMLLLCTCFPLFCLLPRLLIHSAGKRWKLWARKFLEKSLTSNGSAALSMIAFTWNSFVLFTAESDPVHHHHHQHHHHYRHNHLHHRHHHHHQHHYHHHQQHKGNVQFAFNPICPGLAYPRPGDFRLVLG